MPARRRPERRPSAAPASREPVAPRSLALPAVPLAVTAVLASCLALRVLAALAWAPREAWSNWVWGLDALAYVPTPLAALLVACAAATFVPPVGKAIDAALEWAARGGTLARDLLASVAVGALLYAIRDPLRFAGDADIRLGLVATELPTARLFPQALPLDTLLNADLARALTGLGMSAEQALQLIGGALAAAFVALGLALVREAGARGGAVLACVAVLLGGGVLIAFPGYDKFGPLIVGVALAALGAARLAQTGRGAWTLAAGAAVCVVSHRTGFLVLPAVLWAFVQALRRARPGKRARLAIPAACALAAAAAMAPLAVRLFLTFDLAVQRHAAGGALGGATPLVRVTDALNALFFLAPLWPVGAAAAWALRSPDSEPARPPRFALGPVVALALAFPLAVALATRSQQGAARDWDMNSALGTIALLATCGALARLSRRPGGARLWAPLAGVSLAIAVTLWTVSATERAQLRRIESLTTAEPLWNYEQRARALDFLGLRAMVLERWDEAGGYFERAAGIAPNARYYYQAGLARLHARRLDRARALELEAARRAPDKGDSWWALADIARAESDTALARAYEDSARARGTARPGALR